MKPMHPLSALQRRQFEAKLAMLKQLEIEKFADSVALIYFAMAAERMVASGSPLLAERLLDLYVEHLVDRGLVKPDAFERAYRATEPKP